MLCHSTQLVHSIPHRHRRYLKAGVPRHLKAPRAPPQGARGGVAARRGERHTMHFARRHRIAVVAVTALGLGAGSTAMAQAGAGPARPTAAQQLAALSSGAKHSVIVVLKDQHPELSVKTAKAQRKASADKDQAPLVSSAQATGAQDVKKFSVINGFAAKMTDAEAAHLRQDPAVAAVVSDQQHVVKKLTAAQKAAIRDA